MQKVFIDNKVLISERNNITICLLFSRLRKLLWYAKHALWYAKHVLSLSCSFASCRISGLPLISSLSLSLKKKKKFRVGIVLLISAFNRRFSSGVWFHFQGKFAFTGNLIIKTDHTVGTKSRLQTKYKTADLVQNVGCMLSTKCGLGPKCRLKTAD